MSKRPKQPKTVKNLSHEGSTRPNNPTAELEGLIQDEEAHPVEVQYARQNNPDETPELYARDGDLDPQLVWRGKDAEDRAPLRVDALPIYTQEHIHPKVIVEDIRRRAGEEKVAAGEETTDLFADWAGELSPEDRVEFYQHQQKWTNRMILGDSLQVMTSLAEKEGLRGQVQCIYIDPLRLKNMS